MLIKFGKAAIWTKTMPQVVFTRRTTLLALAATLGSSLRPSAGLAAPTEIRVAKDPNCGCCGAWIEVIEREGFQATVDLLDYDALQVHKAQSGVPAEMMSCHTAHVEGYVIEGHVPVADIRRLLSERPDAIGLAVPGMPYGSPGMGPETEREAYAVHLILRDGTTQVFSTYDAA
jgi:hypothetical protein